VSCVTTACYLPLLLMLMPQLLLQLRVAVLWWQVVAIDAGTGGGHPQLAAPLCQFLHQQQPQQPQHDWLAPA
jgi:hypothetical protein